MPLFGRVFASLPGWHAGCCLSVHQARSITVMNIASLIATSRAAAQERAIEVTAMNLANMSTPGFQASRVQFADWLSPQPMGGSIPGERQIAYTQDRATWRDTTPGALTQTGNPFDLALPDGDYFTVATAMGPRLTRDGRFIPTSDGQVTDASGHALLDVNGRPVQITSADTRITITADGGVSSENGSLGRIGVVRPQEPARLKAEGATLFNADTPTSQVARPHVIQGAVEGSNVPPILEVTTMMTAVRDFQFATQFIQAEDDRIQATIDKTLGSNS
jgi:flagellar basal-body rod protein FlgF